MNCQSFCNGTIPLADKLRIKSRNAGSRPDTNILSKIYILRIYNRYGGVITTLSAQSAKLDLLRKKCFIPNSKNPQFLTNRLFFILRDIFILLCIFPNFYQLFPHHWHSIQFIYPLNGRFPTTLIKELIFH